MLTVSDVVEIHWVLLERWGGEEGGGHRGASDEGAEAAVRAVENSYYETVEEFAAAYAVYIIQGHVFMDGNKRTGCGAMAAFLELNGKSGSKRSRDRLIFIELQQRAEAGESAGALIEWLSKLI